CSPSTMKQIGIFTATRWELNAVRRAILVEEQTRIGGARGVVGRRGNGRLFVFQTGVGTAKADAVCRKVFASHPLDLAVSCGFACALTAADIGELLIGTDVIMYQATANPPAAGRVIPCAEHLTAAAVRAAPAAGLPARAGRFVTVPRVVWRAQDKREIAAGTGAVGLDMESAAVGAAALERNIPFAMAGAASPSPLPDPQTASFHRLQVHVRCGPDRRVHRDGAGPADLLHAPEVRVGRGLGLRRGVEYDPGTGPGPGRTDGDGACRFGH